jgi:hypothetical protein
MIGLEECQGAGADLLNGCSCDPEIADQSGPRLATSNVSGGIAG